MARANIYTQLINEKLNDVLVLLSGFSMPTPMNIKFLKKFLERNNLLELHILTNNNSVHIDMIEALKRKGYIIVNRQGMVQKTKKI